MLPHQKNPPEKPEPFTTMDAEMAKVYRETHPHYDEEDYYGNKPVNSDSKDSDDESTS